MEEEYNFYFHDHVIPRMSSLNYLQTVYAYLQTSHEWKNDDEKRFDSEMKSEETVSCSCNKGVDRIFLAFQQKTNEIRA